MRSLCFCDPGAFPPKTGPIEGGNKDRNGPLSFPAQILYDTQQRFAKNQKIMPRADGNNENLCVEKHGIIVFVTAKEHDLMALIYE